MSEQMIKKQLLSKELKKENQDYLSKQLITCIGNKRALLSFIGKGLKTVSNKLDTNKLKVFDVFSGSGVVARYFKQFSDKIIVNDLEKYSQIINNCYLSNYSSLDMTYLKDIYNDLLYKLELEPFKKGMISKLYAPKDDCNIKEGERVFYTTKNANYIDTIIRYIKTIPANLQYFFLAPLLSEASIHTNTSGVFKGYYKNSTNGIGEFGGKNGDALFRIKGDIDLPFPIFSNFECETEIHHGDSNFIANNIDEVDIAYIDPPYNQHPYGSNYFMLNLLCDYKYPKDISSVSGIPTNWNRSDYNKRQKSYQSFSELINNLKSKFLLISFNSEGFIDIKAMMGLLNKIGKVTVLETKYNTFRGSRNLKNRNIHIKEYLYLVEKK